MGALNGGSCLPGKTAVSMSIKEPHLEPQLPPSEHNSSLCGNISSWPSGFLCFWKIWLWKTYIIIYYLYLCINIKFIINKRSLQTKTSGIPAKELYGFVAWERSSLIPQWARICSLSLASLDREWERNTYVVWGWQLPIFAWNEAYTLTARVAQVWGEMSMHLFKLCKFTTGTPRWGMRMVCLAKWVRKSWLQPAFLRLELCKRCASLEGMMGHRRPECCGFLEPRQDIV